MSLTFNRQVVFLKLKPSLMNLFKKYICEGHERKTEKLWQEKKQKDSKQKKKVCIFNIICRLLIWRRFGKNTENFALASVCLLVTIMLFLCSAKVMAMLEAQQKKELEGYNLANQFCDLICIVACYYKIAWIHLKYPIYIVVHCTFKLHVSRHLQSSHTN